ncbi:MAG: SDR family NAD(P)-dependent oxidoreductase [Flavisolibacter sp.]
MNILVTGGSSGLGRSIVETFSSQLHSSQVYFTYHRSADAAKSMEATSSQVHALHCDFASDESMSKLERIIEEKNIQVLVNNALPSYTKNYFHKESDEAFVKSFELNVLPVIRITRAFIQKARKEKFGKIITILSATIDQPSIGSAVYTAEKMYLQGLSRTWAKENINFNISSNSVSPGFMKTRLHADLDERLIEDMEKKHPLKKLLTTDEVAKLVCFLASSSQQINGQNFRIGLD